MFRLNRTALLAVAAIALALLGLSSGCGGGGQPSASVRVVEAAKESRSFYETSITSYRSHHHMFWGPRQTRDWRDPRTFIDATLEVIIDREVVAPDRLHLWHRSYEVAEGGLRRVFAECKDSRDYNEDVVIGKTRYHLQCDDSWQVTELEQQIELSGTRTYLEDYWDTIANLSSIRKIAQEPVRGVLTDVFQGEFFDADGARHQLSVWVGAKDNLIRKLKDEWPLYSVEIEHYDINDSSIIIEPPQ